MPSRKFRWVLMLAALAVVTAVAFVLWPRNTPLVTRENYERIVSDMTPSDVETILGPAGDYRTGPTEECGKTAAAWLSAKRESRVHRCYGDWWESDSAAIFVQMDPEGDILKEYTPCTLKGPLEVFLWRAKRQWRKWFPT
jgi:hypothetical protein